MPSASETYNLLVLRPDLARQWHPTRNGTLGPKDVTPGSGRKIWWLCDQGHWWLASVRDRTRGRTCSRCRALQQQPERRERMQDARPELLKQWHPSRNGALRAVDVAVTHRPKVWWICSQGHEWEATIRERMTGSGCPACGGPPQGRFPGLRPKLGAAALSGERPAFGALRDSNSSGFAGQELRSSRRYEQSAVAMIEKPGLGVWGYARLRNFSAGGMLLSSDFAIGLGEVIHVRLEAPLYPAAPATLTSRVVWCRDLAGRREGFFRFDIGVRLV
jgi:hypothetical protein